MADLATFEGRLEALKARTNIDDVEDFLEWLRRRNEAIPLVLSPSQRRLAKTALTERGVSATLFRGIVDFRVA